MSDKSKLGFNINPKNYDELNSTDNLITSGSDSGWLGKKLQGDDSNDLDLSKINPLFDKELYEKYRPGVNTNDGSVNQDIWGYKCFNSPVSFRNGIYGDTYSITEQKSSGETIDLAPETYATIKSDTTIKNKIYNRTDNDTNNYSEYIYKKYHGPVDYDNSQFTYMDTVIPDSDDHTISDIIIKSHSESHCDNNAFAINDEYERTLCSVRPNYYTASAPDVSDAQYVYSVNYANTQYERKLQAYTPAVYMDNYFVTGEKNVTATFSMHANSPYVLNYGDEPETGANILLETNFTETADGVRYAALNITSPDYDTSSVTLLAKNDSHECNIEVKTDYVQIGAADGDLSITNDKFSRIFVSNNHINKSISGNALDIDYHVKDIETTYMNNPINVSGPAIDITFDYRKTTFSGNQDSSIGTYCVEAAYPAEFQNINGIASINVHGIYMVTDANNVPTYKDYCGTYITPTSVTTNGLQFDLIDWSNVTELSSDAHNKLVPIDYKFKFNDNDTGIDTDGLQLISCKHGGKTTFICDYLVVNESIKYKSTVSYTDRLVYIDPKTNNTTNVLTVQSSNLILPSGNKEVSIGNIDHRLNSVYAENFYGTALWADSAILATKAEQDQHGSIIDKTYLNIKDYGRNDIESYNAIIGDDKERLLFLKEKYFGANADIPPKNKSYAGIKCAFTDVATSYKTVISWSNEAEDKPITKLCYVDYNLAYNYTTKKYSFYIMPNGVASDDPKYVESMNIGAPDAPWDSIYCDKFPTIHNTIGGSTGGTSVGNIRLLAIQSPYMPDTDIYKTIVHGSEIQSPIMIDGKEFNIYVARLGTVVKNGANIIKLMGDIDDVVEGVVVEGKWRLLSSVYITNDRAGIMYTPALAMRVE